MQPHLLTSKRRHIGTPSGLGPPTQSPAVRPVWGALLMSACVQRNDLTFWEMNFGFLAKRWWGLAALVAYVELIRTKTVNCDCSVEMLNLIYWCQRKSVLWDVLAAYCCRNMNWLQIHNQWHIFLVVNRQRRRAKASPRMSTIPEEVNE